MLSLSFLEASGGGGGFFGLFGSKPKAAPKAPAAPEATLTPATGQTLSSSSMFFEVERSWALRMGLYLWGGTGTGKTFMMNMLLGSGACSCQLFELRFYDKLNVKNKPLS